ncbi:MAG: DNA polymerase III subunit delta [Geobacter sp.]|nr:DNA polymerase III subunit delta [Geobacter sp.]
MKPEEFRRAIEKGDIGPLYYLYGDEPYLVEKGVRELTARVVSADFRDFNLNVFYGRECRGAEIVDTAQTLPMFSDRRLVLVKDAERLSVEALEIIGKYVANPSPSTCLVFLGEKPDQRKKFFVELKKNGVLLEFKRPYENQLPVFIRDEAGRHDKKLEPAAVELLVGLIGNNLQELASQIEKVATYAAGRSTITLADVKAVASDSRADSIFDLTNALGGKDLAASLKSLDTLLGDGEAPLFVLNMVTRHFRQIWMVRELLDRRTPASEIGKSLRINPYFLEGTISQAKRFSGKALKGIFDRLFETDLALKSSGGKPDVLMERLVMYICG